MKVCQKCRHTTGHYAICSNLPGGFTYFLCHQCARNLPEHSRPPAPPDQPHCVRCHQVGVPLFRKRNVFGHSFDVCRTCWEELA